MFRSATAGVAALAKVDEDDNPFPMLTAICVNTGPKLGTNDDDEDDIG